LHFILADEKTEECLKVRGEDGVEVESCTHQSYARAVEARAPRESTSYHRGGGLNLANNPAEECLKVRGEDGVEIESCTHQSYARTVEARQPRE